MENFALARAEGIENVTARKLAAQIGCSTQPIFRVYANMGELYSICTVLGVSLGHINLLLLCLTILKEIDGNLREQCI